MIRRALSLGVGLAVVACTTGDGLPEDAVEIEGPDFERSLTLRGCGYDEDGVFVLGADDTDTLLQVLLVLDGDEVDLDASGITVERGRTGVLGAGSPSLIGAETGSAGEIERAVIRGDRIEIDADAVEITADGSSTPGQLVLRARCTAPDEDEAAPDR